MLQDGVREDGVEAVPLERHRVDVGDFEAQVRDAALRRESACGGDNVGVGVDADHLSGGDCQGEPDGDAAGAAARVEETHP
jgi:hypothetical protein